MEIIDAKKAGVQAYRDGRGRAPALNQKFIAAACGSGQVLNMLDAYLYGYDIANLADGMSDLDMPSVKSLALIDAH